MPQSPSPTASPIRTPDSRANIAINAAMQCLGTPYVWGGASFSGVDCSGLIMLAYDAAGIAFPHYSGAMYEDTMRVPLVDIEPGDLALLRLQTATSTWRCTSTPAR